MIIIVIHNFLYCIAIKSTLVDLTLHNLLTNRVMTWQQATNGLVSINRTARSGVAHNAKEVQLSTQLNDKPERLCKRPLNINL